MSSPHLLMMDVKQCQDLKSAAFQSCLVDRVYEFLCMRIKECYLKTRKLVKKHDMLFSLLQRKIRFTHRRKR